MTKEIAIIVLLFVVFAWSFYKSLVYLRSKSTIDTYYKFDLEIPGTTTWAVAFYFIIILLLVISSYVFIQQTNILLPPA